MTVAGRTQIVPSGGENASPASLLLTFVNPLSRRSVILRLIRLLAPTVAALLLAACSTYEATVGALDKTFEQGPSSPQQRHVPKVDLSQAKWYKLTADQPTSNPLRVAIVERDTRVGAMRAVIKHCVEDAAVMRADPALMRNLPDELVGKHWWPGLPKPPEKK